MKLQKPSPMPFGKYKSFQDRIALDMRDRTWPDQIISKAPRWLSTDLRDGNQALIDPMTPDRKRKMFDLLVKLGFKEIEVGFPAASQVDFDFVREIIEQDAIPDDVRISVLTQAREDLIERTVESLVGAKKPTVHLYNATAPVFRKVVFGFDGDGYDQTRDIALQGTQAVMKHAETLLSDADFGYQYSPEIFVDTEPEFALDIVGSVLDMWQPAAGRETVVNLPATVERGTPNTYADQIEWFCRNMPYRDEVAVSLHPHNDRGTGVAAAELGMMAGADRIEGCLFGNGERTGNLDLVTVALNLYTQGVDPELDFSDIDEVIHTVTECNQIGVHERHPYGGDLVFTSFSGSHQDAINKAFASARRRRSATPVDLREGHAPPAGRPKDWLLQAIIRELAVRQGRVATCSRVRLTAACMQIRFSRPHGDTEAGGEIHQRGDPPHLQLRMPAEGQKREPFRSSACVPNQAMSTVACQRSARGRPIVDGQERTWTALDRRRAGEDPRRPVRRRRPPQTTRARHRRPAPQPSTPSGTASSGVPDCRNITGGSLKAVISAVNHAARTARTGAAGPVNAKSRSSPATIDLRVARRWALWRSTVDLTAVA